MMDYKAAGRIIIANNGFNSTLAGQVLKSLHRSVTETLISGIRQVLVHSSANGSTKLIIMKCYFIIHFHNNQILLDIPLFPYGHFLMLFFNSLFFYIGIFPRDTFISCHKIKFHVTFQDSGVVLALSPFSQSHALCLLSKQYQQLLYI